MFGICLFPVWIMLIFSGFLTAAFTKMADVSTEDFCNGVQNVTSSYSDMLMSNYTKEIDASWKIFGNKWMCSMQCPCKKNLNTTWVSLTEPELVTYNRTKKVTDTKDDDGTVLLMFKAE